MSKRDYRRAILDLDQSVRLDPECSIGYVMRGRIFDLSRDRGRAEADYDRALQLDFGPTNATAFSRRADAYAGKRDYKRAVDDLGLALTLELGNADRLRRRCEFKALWGVFDGALVDCDQALRIRPHDPNILESRGLVYLKKGAPDQAIEAFDAAVQIDARRQPNSLYGRAMAKRQKGDVAGSEADIAAASAIKPSVADYMEAMYGIK
ncbi:tetratricopeptide repeat protein [Bradyrhizobium tropiciagri]|uniref:tetratricopeptide repeat protein n=1 Tax=Bradyrhizobium tropiciagri TaxID=312253 RepID=UPI00067E07D0|nr:tetratricopeptide repeat protein [Bradyrhizobium tropiciagri]